MCNWLLGLSRCSSSSGQRPFHQRAAPSPSEFPNQHPGRLPQHHRQVLTVHPQMSLVLSPAFAPMNNAQSEVSFFPGWPRASAPCLLLWPPGLLASTPSTKLQQEPLFREQNAINHLPLENPRPLQELQPHYLIQYSLSL